MRPIVRHGVSYRLACRYESMGLTAAVSQRRTFKAKMLDEGLPPARGMYVSANSLGIFFRRGAKPVHDQDDIRGTRDAHVTSVLPLQPCVIASRSCSPRILPHLSSSGDIFEIP